MIARPALVLAMVCGLIVPAPAARAAEVPYCSVGGAGLCVVDGDTLHQGEQVVRIQNIDAPETREPRCPAEAALGRLATERLAKLLAGGTVVLVKVKGERERDRYGRLLRRVEVDGVDSGDVLVAEGLARAWDGRRHPWC